MRGDHGLAVHALLLERVEVVEGPGVGVGGGVGDGVDGEPLGEVGHPAVDGEVARGGDHVGAVPVARGRVEEVDEAGLTQRGVALGVRRAVLAPYEETALDALLVHPRGVWDEGVEVGEEGEALVMQASDVAREVGVGRGVPLPGIREAEAGGAGLAADPVLGPDGRRRDALVAQDAGDLGEAIGAADGVVPGAEDPVGRVGGAAGVGGDGGHPIAGRVTRDEDEPWHGLERTEQIGRAHV